MSPQPDLRTSKMRVNDDEYSKACKGLEEIIADEDRRSRPRRVPDLESESKALRNLAREMAAAPQKMPKALLDIALGLCQAGTAGLSLLETLPDGEEIFRWTSLTGVLKELEGSFTPRKSSPCGISVDRNAPVVFSYPARYFRCLQDVAKPVVEALVVPIVGESVLGTIWIISHEEGKPFDSEDIRIMTNLADFTSSAFQVMHRFEAAQSAEQVADVEIAERTFELQAKVAELASAEQSLRELTSRLLQLRDEEQRRLARELHDSVGQLLAAMSMNQSLILAEPRLSPTVTRVISETAELTAQVSKEIRTISHLLHPPLLDEVGLASGIRDYLEGFAKRSGMKVDLELAHDFGRLSRDLETALFRIVQECLTNVHRHAESQTATIRVLRSSNEVSLEVADDGKGMPQEQISALDAGRTPGVGLRGMRERIRQLGGTFQISSNGKGTVVLVCLPLAA